MEKKDFISREEEVKLSEINILNFMDSMIEPLKKEPSDRSPEDMRVLIKSSSNLQFFAKMNKKKLNRDRKIHEKCIARLRYQKGAKGELMICHSIYLNKN